MFMTYKKRPYRMCDDDYICQSMEMVAKGGGVLQLHCESGNIIEYLENKLIGEGHIHPTDFPTACPDWAEEEAINRAVKMSAATRCPTYVVHLSTQLASNASSRPRASASASGPRPVPNICCSPTPRWPSSAPLPRSARRSDPRTAPTATRCGRGLRQGNVSIVASDHSPHPRELKQPGWDNIFVDSNGTSIPFGSPGIETIVPLMYSEGVVKRGLPIWWLARVMAENPARIFGIYPRKGVIQVGADADFLILDPNGDRILTSQEPSHQRRLHPVRGLAGQRPPVDHHAARPGAPQRRRNPAAARLRHGSSKAANPAPRWAAP